MCFGFQSTGFYNFLRWPVLVSYHSSIWKFFFHLLKSSSWRLISLFPFFHWWSLFFLATTFLHIAQKLSLYTKENYTLYTLNINFRELYIFLKAWNSVFEMSWYVSDKQVKSLLNPGFAKDYRLRCIALQLIFYGELKWQKNICRVKVTLQKV